MTAPPSTRSCTRSGYPRPIGCKPYLLAKCTTTRNSSSAGSTTSMAAGSTAMRHISNRPGAVDLARAKLAALASGARRLQPTGPRPVGKPIDKAYQSLVRLAAQARQGFLRIRPAVRPRAPEGDRWRRFADGQGLPSGFRSVIPPGAPAAERRRFRASRESRVGRTRGCNHSSLDGAGSVAGGRGVGGSGDRRPISTGDRGVRAVRFRERGSEGERDIHHLLAVARLLDIGDLAAAAVGDANWAILVRSTVLSIQCASSRITPATISLAHLEIDADLLLALDHEVAFSSFCVTTAATLVASCSARRTRPLPSLEPSESSFSNSWRSSRRARTCRACSRPMILAAPNHRHVLAAALDGVLGARSVNFTLTVTRVSDVAGALVMKKRASRCHSGVGGVGGVLHRRHRHLHRLVALGGGRILDRRARRLADINEDGRRCRRHRSEAVSSSEPESLAGRFTDMTVSTGSLGAGDAAGRGGAGRRPVRPLTVLQHALRRWGLVTETTSPSRRPRWPGHGG